jgi:3-deoxy-D-manno-octulosonate 8-phosphate phosphatase (KDO 8-P phosphatase)
MPSSKPLTQTNDFTKKPIIADAAAARARNIKAFVFDVDGVLTDGQLYFSGEGEQLKSFSVHDGLAISWLRQLGMPIGIVTGRTSAIVAKRAGELGFAPIIQGQLDKLSGLQLIAKQWQIPLEQIAYFGDDWPDYRALTHCGFAVTVANAPSQLLSCADYICAKLGGHGAAREVIEWLLDQQGLLADLLMRYQTSTLDAQQ